MNDFATDCKRYIQLHAKKARLEARLEALKERVVPELQAGKQSPRELPYRLVLRKRTRTLTDWMEACRRQLRLWLTDETQVQQRMDEIQTGFAKEETEALYVEINKAYAAGNF